MTKNKIILGGAVLAVVLCAPKVYSTVTAAMRASGVQMPKNATTPIASTFQGLWNDNTTLSNLRFDDGTNSNYVAAIPATTKGDIAAFTGANWSRVAAGSNGQCLTAQSGQTAGLLWASCGSGGSSTLQGAYTAGSAGSQIITETLTNGGIGWKGASTQGVDLMFWEDNATNLIAEINGLGTFPNLQLTQTGFSSGTPGTILTLVGGAHTGLTASTEAADVLFSLNRTVQFATGALTNQRAVYIQAPTYAFVGASTITNASTFTISGAPVAGTNATITNNYALWVAGGNARFDGSIVSGNATLNFKSNLASNATIGTIFDTAQDYFNGQYLFQFNNAGNALFNADFSSFGGGVTEETWFTHLGVAVGGWQYFNSGFYRPVTASDIQPHGNNVNAIGGASNYWHSSYIWQYFGVVQAVAAASTVVLDPLLGETARVSLSSTAIATMSIQTTHTAPGEIFTVEIVQDATGSRTIPTAWGNVKFAGGSYTATTTASKQDTLTFRWDSINNFWYEMSRAVNE